MAKFMFMARSSGMQLIAVGIAVVLWLQVHGQGVGSVTLDVVLQVRGLPENMVIVNDLPDHVRISLSGLQSRLKDLEPQDITVPLDVSDLAEPGVVERALDISDITVPLGMSVKKLQPDRLELQVDRQVVREIAVQAKLELPEDWAVTQVRVEPETVKLRGPEVWLDALTFVDTKPVKPELKPGLFALDTGVESPTGKAIRLVNEKQVLKVFGVLQPETARPKPRSGKGAH